MTLVTNGVLRHQYVETRHAGMALGRHLELDAHSLQFLPEPDLLKQPIKPTEHVPPIPTLDQKALGSCTGNAGTYALASLYGGIDLLALTLNGYPLTSDAVANERFAVELYHQATVKDGFPGRYPPDDTGSSGLGVGRALKADKLISRYVWATTLRAWAALLQRSGTIVGMPWFESFFHPDTNGFIDADPNWPDSGIAGGHELYIEALEAWNDYEPAASIVRFRNSWGDSWGDHGCGRMRLSTYERLKAQIDIKAFVR